MKVLIPSSLKHKLLTYCKEGMPSEISGMGTFKIHEGNLLVTHVDLLEQRQGTSASTSIDANVIAKWIYDSRDREGYCNLWWHSHAAMGVFWSGTDKATIEEAGKEGICLAIVGNAAGDLKAAYYYKTKADVEGLTAAGYVHNDNAEIVEVYDEEGQEGQLHAAIEALQAQIVQLRLGATNQYKSEVSELVKKYMYTGGSYPVYNPVSTTGAVTSLVQGARAMLDASPEDQKKGENIKTVDQAWRQLELYEVDLSMLGDAKNPCGFYFERAKVMSGLCSFLKGCATTHCKLKMSDVEDLSQYCLKTFGLDYRREIYDDQKVQAEIMAAQQFDSGDALDVVDSMAADFSGSPRVASGSISDWDDWADQQYNGRYGY